MMNKTLFRTLFLSIALVISAISCSKLDEHEDIPWQPSPVKEGVPVVDIYVDRGEEVVSKDEYLNATILILEEGKTAVSSRGKIKGRGNYTWNYPKKPYKIKFDEKQSVFGFPENKDWVLLADYCDKSLMRTAYMCEISSALGVNYPLRYRHVKLYVNKEFRGIYILIDQIEKKKWRVDIEDDGYLFENDNYYWAEPLHFVTPVKRYPFTFKYPDPADGEIAEGDEKFEYIRKYMDTFETLLYSDGFLAKDGYRDMVDLQSFAKWFIVAELTATQDPNMFYVLPTRGAKLQTGPLWDAEYTLGLAYRSDPAGAWAAPPFKPVFDQQIWSRWKYYGRMFKDPFFIEAVRKEWAVFKTRIPALQEKLAAVADNISEAQKDNFDKWQILDSYEGAGLICLGSWEAEVEYCAEFLRQRVVWLDEFIAELEWM